MKPQLNIVAISGSLRQQSLSTQLLKAAKRHLPAGVELSIASIAEIPMYNQDLDVEQKPKAVEELISLVNSADGLLFATPEYNHAIPGVLKNTIDWLSRPAFKSPLSAKTSGVLSLSMSPRGGILANESLHQILRITLSPTPTQYPYALGNAHEVFDDSGELIDEDATRRLQRYLSHFVELAKSNQLASA